MIGTMEEGRVVGASSSYGQPFISPLVIKVRALPIRVSQSPARHVTAGRLAAGKVYNSNIEARGSEFDLRREYFFFTKLSIG